ncbi:MobA/MobL family protein [Sphingomicrobium arenosum]|uniref:MobA/MobL family protein n=1 Tax=Sphingomicrobium arenosum TaxID=2233861 RepID=UPI00224004DB|nr:MobA/MobL family protein [Sphingomicrobium arenosum]
MQLESQSLRSRNQALREALSEARGARFRAAKARAVQGFEDEGQARAHRRRLREAERELEELMRRRAIVRVPETHRPRIGGRTALNLYHREKGILEGVVGTSVTRGRDGFHSIHFDFTARGFTSKGRRWRPGEASRAARYIVREDGLEGGENGWFSNIADDRRELTAFFRTLEHFERHDRKNANVYCSEIVALPFEMTEAERRETVDRICEFFRERGLPFVAALHKPDPGGDQRNFHCHIVYSLRPATRTNAYCWSFALGKEADINCPSGIKGRRERVVEQLNASLAQYGHAKRYTARSNRARGEDCPTDKEGQHAVWAARRLAAREQRIKQLGVLRKVTLTTEFNLRRCHQKLQQVEAALRERLSYMKREVGALCVNPPGHEALVTASSKRVEIMRQSVNTLPALSLRLDRARQTTDRFLAGACGAIEDWRARPIRSTYVVTLPLLDEKLKMALSQTAMVGVGPYTAKWRKKVRAHKIDGSPMWPAKPKPPKPRKARENYRIMQRLRKDVKRREPIIRALIEALKAKIEASPSPFGDRWSQIPEPRKGMFTQREHDAFLAWQSTKEGEEYIRARAPAKEPDDPAVETTPSPRQRNASPGLDEEHKRYLELLEEQKRRKSRGR